MTSNKCGTCTACCRVYHIPELMKPAGTWCAHCDIGVGCKIYDRRPKTCIDFECLWLQSQSRDNPDERMAIELRPDNCKVVLSPTINRDGDMDGVAAITMPGSPGAWRSGAIGAFIRRIVANGMTVIAGAPNSSHKTQINRRGEIEVMYTDPDETGMQWSKGVRA